MSYYSTKLLEAIDIDNGIYHFRAWSIHVNEDSTITLFYKSELIEAWAIPNREGIGLAALTLYDYLRQNQDGDVDETISKAYLAMHTLTNAQTNPYGAEINVHNLDLETDMCA